ncbi:MAG: TolC family protein [Planctomycetaceae bacterium]
MRTPALLLLLVGLALPDEAAPAPEPRRNLTLEEAIDLGLAYNLGLESERLGARIARFRVDEQEAAFDALLTGSLSGGEELLPARSTLSGATVLDTDNLHLEAGVTKPLRFGPTLGLAWRSDRSFTNSSFSTINPAYANDLELSMVVPLLRGRGRSARESALRGEQAASEEARFALLAEAASLVTSISGAYWDLAYRQGRVALLRKSVAVARETEESERKKLRPEVGRSTPLDVIQAEAETRRREAELIKGVREAADAADNLRKLVLPFVGGEGDDLLLVADLPGGGGAPPRAVEELVRDALARRPELLAEEAALRRLEESVVQARDAARLQLDFTGTITARGLDGSAGDSLSQAGGLDTLSAAARLDFSYPFGRRQAKAALRRSELERERGRLDRLEQLNVVVAEVRQARRAVVSSLEEIAATELEVKAAAEALRGEQQRLLRGSSTVLQVSELEERLTEAEVRLLQARVERERASLELERVSGDLLERLGIRLDGELRVLRGPAGR